MPFVCILVTRRFAVSNPSTSYIATLSRADPFGGLLSCHCHETRRPGCQHAGHATGAATAAGAVTGGLATAPARPGAHADITAAQTRDNEASRTSRARYRPARRQSLTSLDDGERRIGVGGLGARDRSARLAQMRAELVGAVG